LKVNFATVMSIKFTSIDVDTYLDIANLEIWHHPWDAIHEDTQ
jgi:hypothetical protein